MSVTDYMFVAASWIVVYVFGYYHGKNYVKQKYIEFLADPDCESWSYIDCKEKINSM